MALLKGEIGSSVSVRQILGAVEEPMRCRQSEAWPSSLATVSEHQTSLQLLSSNLSLYFRRESFYPHVDKSSSKPITALIEVGRSENHGLEGQRCDMSELIPKTQDTLPEVIPSCIDSLATYVWIAPIVE
jgi:hypothetical protein